ncbi:hypothetical protein BDW75DRAFT_208921 [Aspergillus navahoensis]
MWSHASVVCVVWLGSSSLSLSISDSALVVPPDTAGHVGSESQANEIRAFFRGGSCRYLGWLSPSPSPYLDFIEMSRFNDPSPSSSLLSSSYPIFSASRFAPKI